MILWISLPKIFGRNFSTSCCLSVSYTHLVDSDRVTSIRLVNLSESTAAMFPLMEPALESLASQIYTSQSLENIQYSEDQKYTSMILLNAIETALKKAENN